MRALFRRSTTPQITPAELQARIAAGERVQLIDVRERSEWNQGHIPGSLHIPLGELQRNAGRVARDLPVVMVCRSGNRSGQATAAFQSAGYSNVLNLDGGVLAWANARLPLER
ncbi:MAG: rhodanese-like domain-containing protein [Chloroflexi bacterium]|nr:MAG: rhodanese-like domain-containing protein [Chloroflexota bacterium]